MERKNEPTNQPNHLRRDRRGTTKAGGIVLGGWRLEHNGKENSKAASRQQDEGPENAETTFP